MRIYLAAGLAALTLFALAGRGDAGPARPHRRPRSFHTHSNGNRSPTFRHLIEAIHSGAEASPSVSQVLRIIIDRQEDWARRAVILAIGDEVVARSPTFSDLLHRLLDDRYVLLYVRFAQLRTPPP